MSGFHFHHHRHHDDRDDGGNDDNLSPVFLNAALDVTATDGNGHILSGSGNPSTGW
jgi:hypothetical protein